MKHTQFGRSFLWKIMHNYKTLPTPQFGSMINSPPQVDFMLKRLDTSCAINSAHIHVERAQLGRRRANGFSFGHPHVGIREAVRNV